jgi:type IV secretory pathway protease TraF
MVKGHKKKKTIKDFTWQFGVKMIGVCGILCGSIAYAGARYKVGLDTQEYRCLDEWVYIIDTWDVPDADDVKRDDYVAISLTAEQTPANALWQPGQVMVKRAVATDEGDVAHISAEGISFSHGPEIWAHGTALEAATSLGHAPEFYERDIALKDGELFMMGDRVKSYDSRYYGPISEEQIVGRVVWAF